MPPPDPTLEFRYVVPLGNADFDTRLCTFALASEHLIDVVAPQGAFAVFWRFDSWVAVLFAEPAKRSQLSVQIVTSTQTPPLVIREPKWWLANLDPSPAQPADYAFPLTRHARDNEGIVALPEERESQGEAGSVQPKARGFDAMSGTAGQAPPKESASRIEARSIQPRFLSDAPNIQSKARAAAMFREFDRYTHPAFVGRSRSVLPPRPDYATLDDGVNLSLEFEFRNLLTTRVMAVLADRVASRWRMADGDSAEELKKAYEVWLGYLSSLQLTFYRRWYGDLSSEQRLAKLTDAFIWFGAGELVLRGKPDTLALSKTLGHISQGGPDGTAICLFTEFALAAIESRIDPGVWTRLLPGLLAMIEAYAIAYGRGAPTSPYLYPALPNRRLTDAELHRLRDVAAARRQRLEENESDADDKGFVEEMTGEFARLLRTMFSDRYLVTGVRVQLASQPDDAPQ